MRFDKTKALLVLAAGGLLVVNGWFGWQIYQFMKVGRVQLYKSLKTRFDKARTAKETAKASEYWNFNPQSNWEIFKKANFHGYVPPKVVEPVAPTGPIKKRDERHDPIADILELKMIMGREGTGFALVAYKGSVKAPGEELASSQSKDHLIAVGETLYEPHHNWTLKAVLGTGRGLLFEWKDPSGKVKEVDKEEIHLKEIEPTMEQGSEEGLPYAKEGQATVAARPGTGKGTKPVKTRPVKPGRIPKSLLGGKKIAKVPDEGLWVVPPAVQKEWERNPQKALEGVRLKAIRLPKEARRRNKGQRSGLAIAKLSPAMQQVGLEQGMILLAINGKPVSSKASATATCKKLYKRGVRTFQAKVLYYGREQIITYRVADRK